MNTCNRCEALISVHDADVAKLINGGLEETMCQDCSLECMPAKTKYIVTAYTESGYTSYEEVEAYTLAGASYLASQFAKQQVQKKGQWIQSGENLETKYRFTINEEYKIVMFWGLYLNLNHESETVADGFELYNVEPNHCQLIENAGGNSECDHKWEATYEVEGGMKENAGVWQNGATMEYKKHCSKCSMGQTETRFIDPKSINNNFVQYAKIKYPINIAVWLELVELDELGAFGEDYDDAEKVLGIDLEELTLECDVLLHDSWEAAGFNPNKTITAKAMARYLKNKKA